MEEWNEYIGIPSYIRASISLVSMFMTIMESPNCWCPSCLTWNRGPTEPVHRRGGDNLPTRFWQVWVQNLDNQTVSPLPPNFSFDLLSALTDCCYCNRILGLKVGKLLFYSAKVKSNYAHPFRCRGIIFGAKDMKKIPPNGCGSFVNCVWANPWNSLKTTVYTLGK